MMTEDEARDRWCPFVRTVSEAAGETAANRWPGDGDAEAGTTNTCIASQCMAWRWVMSDGEFAALGAPPANRRGFCGLAGKP